MSDPVKRPYDAPRRRAQAAVTRAAILDAAQRRFERDGYAATPMAAIAQDAGVALKTVYLAFETKPGLLRALWNLRLRGDDAPVSEQRWYREVLEEPDAERRLRRNARNSRMGKERIGALTEVIRAAATTDADIAGLWERINTDYRANQRAVLEGIAGALKDDVEQATDVLWTINHPATWHLLVGRRGWSGDAYERWAGDSAVALLLAQEAVHR